MDREWIAKRFWSKTLKTPACWLWTGRKRGNGYGYIRVPTDNPYKRKKVSATHISWMLHHGEMPHPTMLVCHKCDNPSCVNPDHLFLGTERDNQHDASVKGRKARGQRVNTNKLTEEDVRRIRELYPTRNQVSIAKEYGVSQPMIGYIVRRESWTWLKS